MSQLDLSAFLSRTRISEDEWIKSGCSWETLVAIHEHHSSRTPDLVRFAELAANTIQKFAQVHSVRWRVKDPDHLIAKVIRKCIGGSSKYRDVDASNYNEVITDLVGLRAMHLFKEDGLAIADQLAATWDRREQVIAYIREGDPPELTEKYKSAGFDVQNHPASYRSIHFVSGSKPTNVQIVFEVQIRTVMEEGWSEIDHKIRYPSLSNDALIGHSLIMLNRLAGAADEMGSLVRNLVAELQDRQRQYAEVKKDRDTALDKIAEIAEELDEAIQTREQQKELAQSLRKQVDQLKPSTLTLSLGRPFDGLLSGVNAADLGVFTNVGSSLNYDHLNVGSAAERLAGQAIDSAGKPVIAGSNFRLPKTKK